MSNKIQGASFISLLWFLLAAHSLSGFETNNFQIHSRIINTQHAGKPQIFEDHLFLSYETESPVRFVGVAFSHENFSKIHSFIRNVNGIFVFVYPLPDAVDTVIYRIVVDGLWMADPSNPVIEKDPSGIYLSSVSLPPKEVNRWKLVAPVIHDHSSVDFYYFGTPGQDIYISGTFNNWDPFMHKLEELTPGRYSISLKVLPGTHFYYFLANGLFLLDPLNPDKGSDSEGFEVSMFEIKAPASLKPEEEKKGFKLFN